jgi:hypothetical protein
MLVSGFSIKNKGLFVFLPLISILTVILPPKFQLCGLPLPFQNEQNVYPYSAMGC